MRKAIKSKMRRLHKLLSKRYYRIIFFRWISAVSFSIIFTAILGSLLFSTKVSAQSNTEEIMYKYYTVIEVEEGDTLWDYAEQYRCTTAQTNEDYILEVKSINHIYGDDIIEGTKIVLPYYSNEYICSMDN